MRERDDALAIRGAKPILDEAVEARLKQLCGEQKELLARLKNRTPLSRRARKQRLAHRTGRIF